VTTRTRTVAAPATLRIRRFWRRLTPIRTFSVARQIVVHPSNSGNRIGALARSVRWQLRSRVRPEPVDVSVWGDLRLRCYPRSNSANNVVYFTERFEPAEMAFIERIVHPGETVVDAGANIGAYSLFLAHLVGGEGQVIAIEPGARAAARLEENVALNGLDQVRVATVAVGAESGTREMTVAADVSNTLTVGPGTSEVISVPVVPLDDLVTGSVAFIKLDVEGYEHEALRGASIVLADRPVLQLELTDHLLRRMESSALAVVEHVRSLDYRVASVVLEAGRVRLSDPCCANVIAVPSERWAAVEDRLG
jgi:FkbM family methyltransferase